MARFLTFWIKKETSTTGSVHIDGDFNAAYGVTVKFGPEGWIRFGAAAIVLSPTLDSTGKLTGQQTIRCSLNAPPGTNVRITVQFGATEVYTFGGADPGLDVHGPNITSGEHDEP